MWSKKEGYPSTEFYKALDPRLENLIADKMSTPITPLGAKAGEITPEAAGLPDFVLVPPLRWAMWTPMLPFPR